MHPDAFTWIKKYSALSPVRSIRQAMGVVSYSRAIAQFAMQRVL